MKKLLSIALILAMLASLIVAAIPVSAARDDDEPVMDKPWENGETDWTKITTAAGLAKVENNKKYYLDADITFNVSDYAGKTPVGVTIHGNGHTVTIKDTAIYGKVADLTVKWLNIAGSVDCNNSSAKSFCSPFGVYNDGVDFNGTKHPVKVTFENVTSSVDITYSWSQNRFQSVSGVVHKATAGSSFKNVKYTGDIIFKKNAFVDYVGALVASAENTTFENCEVSGNIICASVLRTLMVDDSGTPVYQSSDNKQYENDRSVEIGGFCGKANGCTFTDCTQKGYIDFFGSSRGSRGVKGAASVGATGGNASYAYIGGFVGYLGNSGSDSTTTFTNCTNGTAKDAYAGDIYLEGNCGGVGCAGGLVGWSQRTNLTMTNCKNYGDIDTEAQGVWWQGGMIGYWEDLTAGSSKSFINLENCVNNGTIESYNTGATNESYNGQGGIVGYIYAAYDTTDVEAIIKNCTNNGDMISKKNGLACVSMMGGIVGQLIGVPSVSFENCVNHGDVIKPDAVKKEGFGVGGILGGARCYGATWTGIKAATITFTNCVNTATVSGANAAGIFGACNTEVYLIGEKSYKEDGVTVKVDYGTANIEDLKLNFISCTNAGDIIDPRATNAAGMVANLGAWTTTITDCNNGGAIMSAGVAAGLVASAKAASKHSKPSVPNDPANVPIAITNAVNYGDIGYADSIKTTGSAGGMLGVANAADVTITKALNIGKIIAITNNPISNAVLTSASTNNQYLKGDSFDDNATEIATLAAAEAAAQAKGLRACTYMPAYNLAVEYVTNSELYIYDGKDATWAQVIKVLEGIIEEFENGMADIFNYSQTTANATCEKFMAKAELIRLKPDFTEIKKEIERGEAKLNDGNKYDKTTTNKLNKALETAKGLVAMGDAANGNDVVEALAALTKAINTLRRITVSTDNGDDDNNNNNNNNVEQTPDEDENSGEENNDQPTNEPEDTQPATAAPEASDDEVATEEGGCGSVIGGAAIALTAVIALGAGVSLKKKED